MADIQNEGIMAGRRKLRDETREVDLQLHLMETLIKHTNARTHTTPPPQKKKRKEKKRLGVFEVLGRILKSYEYAEVGAQNCLTTFALAVSTRTNTCPLLPQNQRHWHSWLVLATEFLDTNTREFILQFVALSIVCQPIPICTWTLL